MAIRAAYVENDPFACAWLRELIKGGYITDGEVIEQSLEDVRPCDLARFDRVHLCAGVAIWDYALNEAGWGERPVWTASFPCQPFSAAGKGLGFADERHIWPSGHWLIRECGVDILLGEQVASKDGLAWFDVVSSDLEADGYAVGSVDLCAAGFGAPHIRQRNYWCALGDSNRFGKVALGGVSRRTDTECEGGARTALVHAQGEQTRLPRRTRLAGGSDGGTLADTDGGDAGTKGLQRSGEHGQQPQDGGAGRGLQHAKGDGRIEWRPEPSGRSAPGEGGAAGGGLLADDDSAGQTAHGGDLGEVSGLQEAQRKSEHGAAIPGRSGSFEFVGDAERNGLRISGRSLADFPDQSGDGPLSTLTRGRWAGADWIFCRDGKWRPVEPGTFPLATGYPNRVGLLRGYGNALTAPVAKGFIEAMMDILESGRDLL